MTSRPRRAGRGSSHNRSSRAIDRIAELWGTRTPYAPAAGRSDWPVRVDRHLSVKANEVEQWVQSACVLCSNGCAVDIAVSQSVVRSVHNVDVIWRDAVPENDDAEEVAEADEDLVAYEIATLPSVIQLANIGSADEFWEIVPQVVATDPHAGTDRRPPSDVESLALIDDVLWPPSARAESEGHE